MPAVDLMISLGVALAVGLLIGFEREQAKPDAGDGSFLGGARTHPLIALAGALSMALAPHAGVLVLPVVLAGILVFLALAYREDLRRGEGLGITSEVAFIVTFLLGALAASPQVIADTGRRATVLLGVTVVSTFMLSMKERMHGFARSVSREDVYAALKFLIVAVVVLPQLPREPIVQGGPLSVLEPFNVGLLVVLIAGIGFVGYVAVRILGPGRGLGVTGVVGGLASSTAVTLSVARQAREEPALAAACALAVVSASTVMFPRVLVLVAVVHRPLLARVAVPVVAMALVGVAASLLFYRRSKRVMAESENDLRIRNPFALSTALKFGLLYAVVLVLSKLASDHFGASGSYAAGVLAGFTDVDAITLSTARLAGGGIELDVAATTIVLGAASNTLAKGILAVVIGGWAFGRRVLLTCAAVIVAGGAGLAVVRAGLVSLG